jgi:hypothetical protein
MRSGQSQSPPAFAAFDAAEKAMVSDSSLLQKIRNQIRLRPMNGHVLSPLKNAPRGLRTKTVREKPRGKNFERKPLVTL